ETHVLIFRCAWQNKMAKLVNHHKNAEDNNKGNDCGHMCSLMVRQCQTNAALAIPVVNCQTDLKYRRALAEFYRNL
ncbi:hypothetical protein AAULR_12777, partial [Lacticaseibacillus rhamnosus MTCC 5462]